LFTTLLLIFLEFFLQQTWSDAIRNYICAPVKKMTGAIFSPEVL